MIVEVGREGLMAPLEFKLIGIAKNED